MNSTKENDMGKNTMKAAMLAAVLIKDKSTDELKEIQEQVETEEGRKVFADHLQEQLAEADFKAQLSNELCKEITECVKGHVETKLLAI